MKIRSKSNSQHGFTLIEVMMVITMIAILATVAFPYYGGFLDNRNLKSAAEDIAGDIYLMSQSASAGSTAANTSGWYQITFTQATNSYQMVQCADTATPSCNSNSTIAIKSPSAFSSDITITGVNFNNGNIIQMQPRGIVNPASGGTITLQNGRQSTATISINLTGRAYVSWNLK
ncbi:MAG: Tfp pilus assembly protein FimT/FimU [Dissulfurispiraceae bacterium]